jgi:hypothetical protein
MPKSMRQVHAVRYFWLKVQGSASAELQKEFWDLLLAGEHFTGQAQGESRCRQESKCGTAIWHGPWIDVNSHSDWGCGGDNCKH